MLKMMNNQMVMKNKTMQNQKLKNLNNSFDKLVSNKKDDNKFKNVLDSEKKSNIKKIDRKDVKDLKGKKIEVDEEELESKAKSKEISDEILSLLSQLLDMPVEELKEMDLEKILNMVESELEIDMLSNLKLMDVSSDSLEDLLSNENIDLDSLKDLALNLESKLSTKNNFGNIDEEQMITTELLTSEEDSKRINKNDIEESEEIDNILKTDEKIIEEVNIDKDDKLNNEEFLNKEQDMESKEVNKKIKSKGNDDSSIDLEAEDVENLEVEQDVDIFNFNNIERKGENIFIETKHDLSNDVEVFENIDQDNVIKQVVDNMEFDLSEGKNQVRINLKPNELGEMIMNLEVTKGEVAARITVENYKTKEILEANIQNLQEELEETGMEIKSFEVFVGQDSDFERDGNERFNFFNQKNKFKQLNKKGKIKNISSNYEVGTIEEVEVKNQGIIDGNMDFLV